MSPNPPYSYPTTNSDLKKYHKLQTHPEGGYFVETINLKTVPGRSELYPGLPFTAPDVTLGDRHLISTGSGTELLPTQFSGLEVGKDSVGEKEGKEEIWGTQIYYMLDPDSPLGYLHTNLHAHFVLLHQGRLEYTLIKPPSSSSKIPIIKKITMGLDIKNGEVSQMFVPAGWWKGTEIPQKDLNLVEQDEGMRENIGALVTEVVVPGWVFEQMGFISKETLKSAWNGKSGWEEFEKFISPHM